MTNVVVGAGSGMGVAVARKLAPRGRLIIADYNLAGVEALANELGGNVVAVKCDITDQADIDALFAQVDDLEALVVTAGLSTSQAEGRRILAVNLAGVATLLKAAEPKLREGTVGVIFASQSGYLVPHVPELFDVMDKPLAPDLLDRLDEFFEVDNRGLAYQASKRGVHRLARNLAATWGKKGARILSLSPGINDTPMNRGDEANNPEVMAKIIADSPLGRRGTPDEIANVVGFLTSADASYLTGSDVLVDGGMVTALPSYAWEGKLRVRQSA